MRIGVSVVVILAIMLCAIWLFTFALYPYGSMSSLTWSEFRKQQDVDTVCVGSSLGKRSFDPNVFDARLGTESFNMCSPLQSPSESYLALKEAVEHHDIETAFYAVDMIELSGSYEMYPGRAFLREKWKGDDFLQRFSDLAFALPDCSWMFGDKSINWLFPWVEQRVSLYGVADNMRMKVDGTSIVQATERNEEIIGSNWEYYGKGYGGYDAVCDYNAANPGREATADATTLNGTDLHYLAEICDLCAKEGIRFVAFVPPRPDFETIEMAPYYAEHSARLRSLVEEHGGRYYDFNLARPELFESHEDYYMDWEHCNPQGAAAMSESLARIVQALDRGEDLDGLFMSYEQKLGAIDTISAVTLEADVMSEGIRLDAKCLAGTNVRPEYQFVVTDGQGNGAVVRDYSPEGSFSYVPPQSGTYEIRVNARRAGSAAEYEKYLCRTVVYSAR